MLNEIKMLNEILDEMHATLKICRDSSEIGSRFMFVISVSLFKFIKGHCINIPLTEIKEDSQCYLFSVPVTIDYSNNDLKWKLLTIQAVRTYEKFENEFEVGKSGV